MVVSIGRENIKHHVRKVSKDLQKLFNKKSSIDVGNASETSKLSQDVSKDHFLLTRLPG